MPKPILLTIAHELEVVRAVERELQRHYAERYRAMRVDSGGAALEALQEFKQWNDAVDLLLTLTRLLSSLLTTVVLRVDVIHAGWRSGPGSNGATSGIEQTQTGRLKYRSCPENNRT